MIRSYVLPVERNDDVLSVKGIEFIHDALVLAMESPDTMLLIQETNDYEHANLASFTLDWQVADPPDIALYQANVSTAPPDLDTLRVQELLENSPDVITQPEIWELLRLFGKRLGYRF